MDVKITVSLPSIKRGLWMSDYIVQTITIVNTSSTASPAFVSFLSVLGYYFHHILWDSHDAVL
jgi:hypothetical protein